MEYQFKLVKPRVLKENILYQFPLYTLNNETNNKDTFSLDFVNTELYYGFSDSEEKVNFSIVPTEEVLFKINELKEYVSKKIFNTRKQWFNKNHIPQKEDIDKMTEFVFKLETEKQLFLIEQQIPNNDLDPTQQGKTVFGSLTMAVQNIFLDTQQQIIYCDWSIKDIHEIIYQNEQEQVEEQVQEQVQGQVEENVEEQVQEQVQENVEDNTVSNDLTERIKLQQLQKLFVKYENVEHIHNKLNEALKKVYKEQQRLKFYCQNAEKLQKFNGIRSFNDMEVEDIEFIQQIMNVLC